MKLLRRFRPGIAVIDPAGSISTLSAPHYLNSGGVASLIAGQLEITPMLALWLPILLSAVFVFILSGIFHMALPWHKSDYQKLPDEEGVRAALQRFDVPPGDYTMPMCGDGNYNSPEFKAKLDAGPNWVMTVLPKGSFNMGLTFVQWFVFLLVVNFLVAYVAVHAVGANTHYLGVFRIVGAVAFLAYAGAQWPQSIWMRRKWSTTVKCTVDGLAYGLVTAGTFAWLWPR